MRSALNRIAALARARSPQGYLPDPSWIESDRERSCQPAARAPSIKAAHNNAMGQECQSLSAGSNRCQPLGRLFREPRQMEAAIEEPSLVIMRDK